MDMTIGGSSTCTANYPHTRYVPLSKDINTTSDSGSNSLSNSHVGYAGHPLPYQRWWIIFLFWFVAVQQDLSWLILAPIQREMKIGFGPTWDSSFIRWTLNLGNIAYLVFTMPCALMCDRLGRRYLTLFCIGCTVIGNLMRLIEFDEDYDEWAQIVMQISCAVIGM